MKYKLKDHIAVSDSGVLFNTMTGESFASNEMGMRILQNIRRKSDKEKLKEDIMAEFEVQEDIVTSDLDVFIRFLVYHDLAEEFKGDLD